MHQMRSIDKACPTLTLVSNGDGKKLILLNLGFQNYDMKEIKAQIFRSIKLGLKKKKRAIFKDWQTLLAKAPKIRDRIPLATENVYEKTKIYEKEAGAGPLKKVINQEHQDFTGPKVTTSNWLSFLGMLLKQGVSQQAQLSCFGSLTGLLFFSTFCPRE